VACRRDRGRWLACLIQVRYPDSGGLTAEGRARREVVRLQAAALFAQDGPVPEIASRLRVSHNAVYMPRSVRRFSSGVEGSSALSCRGVSG
jgi:hypothetical protein